ncbi:MAG: helix-turn-helix transcriptional regulator, partial [Bilophila sp.]
GAHVGVDTAQMHPVSGELFAVVIPPEGVLFRRLWSQASQSDGADANQLILRAEQPGYPDTILSTEAFRKRVVGRLIWSFQMC